MFPSIDAKVNLSDQRRKIHPHKFTMWLGLGSIAMMFAAFTSAYIVKRQQPGWTTFEVPRVFWYSSLVILLSSLAVQRALKSFKAREMTQYRRLITVTAILGLLFIALQLVGFEQIWNSGVTLKGSGGGQFLYIIAGLHAIHVFGGVIVLLVLFFRAFNARIRSYDPVPVEVAATYWHFVDGLWLYLFIFFLWIR